MGTFSFLVGFFLGAQRKKRKSLDDSWVFRPPQKLGRWLRGPPWPQLIPSTRLDPKHQTSSNISNPINSTTQASPPDPESFLWPEPPKPNPDTTGSRKVVLTPEEVLLTWCHCAEKAVRCHSCLWLQQAPLLFFCGFLDPWHVLNQEHAACHEEKKMEKPSARHAFTYQLFGWPQVTTRSGFIAEKKKNCRDKYRLCG